jgi:predicted acetyltransferase
MYTFSLLDEAKMRSMAVLQMNAYPSIAQNSTVEQYAENLAKTHSRPDVKYYCAFKEDIMVGGYNVWDFNMNMRGGMVKAGGIGGIAVDLLYKKEKVCREIMRNFFGTLKGKGVNLAMLYPFNSAFYHKMGYGFGTLLQQFRIKPSDLPGGKSKAHIIRLSEDSANNLTDFYNLMVKTTHGLIEKNTDEFAARLKNPANKVYAYVCGSSVRGYIVFGFRKGSEESFLVNDMVITEMLFDSAEVFSELMAFVKSQSDQVRYVIINTQDEGFINTVADPRNHMERVLSPVYQECCRTGLGIMYRICDIEGFFSDIQHCRFGNLNLKLLINITDSFIKENNKPFLLEFNDGKCTVGGGKHNAALSIDIAEFSSLVMGCVNLKPLVKYGKATLSDAAYLDVLSRAFAIDEKPVCLTYF